MTVTPQATVTAARSVARILRTRLAAEGVPAERINAEIEALRPTSFLTAGGKPDTPVIEAHAKAVAAKVPRSGVRRGRDLYDQRLHPNSAAS